MLDALIVLRLIRVAPPADGLRKSLPPSSSFSPPLPGGFLARNERAELTRTAKPFQRAVRPQAGDFLCDIFTLGVGSRARVATPTSHSSCGAGKLFSVNFFPSRPNPVFITNPSLMWLFRDQLFLAKVCWACEFQLRALPFSASPGPFHGHFIEQDALFPHAEPDAPAPSGEISSSRFFFSAEQPSPPN